MPLATRPAPETEPLTDYTFESYRNTDGSVGTKNLLGIMTSVQCTASMANQAAARIEKVLLPKYPNVDGVVANPAVGYAADLIVRAGGAVMFSEVTEVRDAIHLLTPRAINEEVGRALLHEMEWYDDYLANGQADRSANPSPGNKKGGLANVVEKSLGSIAKSGSSQLVDVIGPGMRIRKKGPTFAASPASDFICGTLQLAAGMNLEVFTSGCGTPYSLAMAPVIKVATSMALAQRWFDLIDVASGREQAAADRLGLQNDLLCSTPVR